MKLLTIAAAICVTILFPALAEAKGAICEHVQSDLFSVDGMADDWDSFKATSYGGGRDAAVDLYCAYDDQKLYFLLNVTDERVLRTKKARPKSEDRISLKLAVGKARPIQVSFLPGSLRAKAKRISAPSYVEIEDSLQDRGFSVELSIPLRKFRDWSPSVPFLSGTVLFHDADLPSDGKAQSVIGLHGKMHFSDAVATYRSFMKTVRLSNRDLRLDVVANVDTGAGPERILVGGKILGVLGSSFSYMTLPIASAQDLLSVRIVDFDGSGRSGIVTELRQHGNGGSRDIVAVWFAGGDGSFQSALMVETRKEMGGAILQNNWSIVSREKYRGEEEPKKKRRKKRKKRKLPPGSDLLVQVGEVTGFSATNYREAPSPDAKPILTPWGTQQSAVYFLDGTIAYGGDAAVGLEDTP